MPSCKVRYGKLQSSDICNSCLFMRYHKHLHSYFETQVLKFWVVFADYLPILHLSEYIGNLTSISIQNQYLLHFSPADRLTAQYLSLFSQNQHRTIVLNIILDPVFILLLHQGVAGTAWATIISKAIASDYGDYVISPYGVATKMITIAFMLVLGYALGYAPFVGRLADILTAIVAILGDSSDTQIKRNLQGRYGFNGTVIR